MDSPDYSTNFFWKNFNDFTRAADNCKAGTIVVVDASAANENKSYNRAWLVADWNDTLAIHGPGSLSFSGMTNEDRDRFIKELDLNNLVASKPSDIEQVHAQIISNNKGSLEEFSTLLKLEVLLMPPSFRAVREEMDMLLSRSDGSTYDFDLMKRWLADKGSQALVIHSDAGAGKTFASAALKKHQREWLGTNTGFFAFYLLKRCDKKSLDPAGIVRSIAHRVAQNLRPYANYLISKVGVDRVELMKDAKAAVQGLLMPMADHLPTGEQALILLDGIDEAEGSPAIDLITKHLTMLPKDKFRFIFTRRSSFTESLRFDQPTLIHLRDFVTSCSGGSMIYHTIVNECHLLKLYSKIEMPTVTDVYHAYAAVFDRHRPSGKVLDLLSVIVASSESLSAFRLGRMGFHQEKHIEALPGWGCLFFFRGSQLFIISSTLKDWLTDKAHSQGHFVDVHRGYMLLGKHLVENRGWDGW